MFLLKTNKNSSMADNSTWTCCISTAPAVAVSPNARGRVDSHDYDAGVRTH